MTSKSLLTISKVNLIDKGRKLLEENPWFTDEHFRKIFHENIDYRLDLASLVSDELP